MKKGVGGTLVLRLKPELLHRAGFEIVADNTGSSDQPECCFLPLGFLQIERYAFLIAIEHRKEARTRAEQFARVLSRDRFDLYDFGAVAKHHATGRAHHQCCVRGTLD